MSLPLSMAVCKNAIIRCCFVVVVVVVVYCCCANSYRGLWYWFGYCLGCEKSVDLLVA